MFTFFVLQKRKLTLEQKSGRNDVTQMTALGTFGLYEDMGKIEYSTLSIG